MNVRREAGAGAVDGRFTPPQSDETRLPPIGEFASLVPESTLGTAVVLAGVSRIGMIALFV